MADEKTYKKTYDEMKQKGYCQKTSYDKYRGRLKNRDTEAKRKSFEDRKIRTVSI